METRLVLINEQHCFVDSQMNINRLPILRCGGRVVRGKQESYEQRRHAQHGNFEHVNDAPARDSLRTAHLCGEHRKQQHGFRKNSTLRLPQLQTAVAS